MRMKDLEIENFRGFRRFQMKDLGRINLIVGTNNCGKTTVLEAVHILMGFGNATTIWSTLSRRGETFGNNGDVQIDVCRLYRGHRLDFGTTFRISTEGGENTLGLVAAIQEERPGQSRSAPPSPPAPGEPAEPFLSPRLLSLKWSSKVPPQQAIAEIPINTRGGIGYEATFRPSGVYPGYEFPLRFATATSITAEAAAAFFEEIVLTPEEDMIVEALRIIEPSIERIAPGRSEKSSTGSSSSRRSSIFVRLKGVKDRVPIGTMGDGVWRLLGLALNIAPSANGILLIDEIDTGLHHTVMKNMWRFIYSAARKYNVQVFATTHSRDCYQSLAAIARESVTEMSEVTIHRIEPDRDRAVAYSEQEIVAAAKHDIEVR